MCPTPNDNVIKGLIKTEKVLIDGSQKGVVSAGLTYKNRSCNPSNTPFFTGQLLTDPYLMAAIAAA
ncbi:hypothetical protein SAMN06269250_2120 [Spirosoma fluviale]|uniref:Uncharacterized protein n=1 Tax=Spirosoma fluviale TaxID=1597977 RepID=A0A286FGP6_9BACT|nr:hypothetical protein SAMN06269250_2120 [Spirosoma fluviale]